MKKFFAIAISLALISMGVGAQAAQKTAAPKYFTGPCEFESKIPKEWSQLQNYFFKINHCLGPVKIVPTSLTKARPKSSLSNASKYEEISRCKIENSTVTQMRARAFPNPSQKEYFSHFLHPSANTVIQVVPIASPDIPAPNGSTPASDYGMYFKFLTDYFRYASDAPSKFEIRVPEKYLQFSKPLYPFDITHHADDAHMLSQRQLGPQIISEVDRSIDFAGANMVLVVVPANADPDRLEQGSLGWAAADDTQLRMISTAQPANLKIKATRNKAFMSPMWWMHELYHVGAGLEDHNGNNFWQNMRGTDETEPGMGNWGIMSMSKTEMTTWEKWLLGMTLDSQVHCVPGNSTSTSWIAPTGIKTLEKKLVVVPVSDSRVIVVESRRAAGLDYKLPKSAEGALVYTVDTSISDSEFGFKIVSKMKPSLGTPFLLSNAPLKKGEWVIVDGVKITNVELGSFGDVVKVDPVK